MKINFNNIFIIAAFFLSSCSNDEKRSTGPGAAVYETTQGSSSSNITEAPSGTLPAAADQSPPAASQSSQPVSALPPANNLSGGTRLNPPHGQPGHVCAVEVGKPLPEKSTVQSSPVQINSPATASPVVTRQQPAAPVLSPSLPVAKAGLNPEHGKPGHRCDIAVGAPLNSAPAQAATSTTTPTVTTTQQNSLPQKITVPPVSATPPVPLPTAPVAAGLNPEHGKPGHRCDIAVGSPLPKQ